MHDSNYDAELADEDSKISDDERYERQQKAWLIKEDLSEEY